MWNNDWPRFCPKVAELQVDKLQRADLQVSITMKMIHAGTMAFLVLGLIACGEQSVEVSADADEQGHSAPSAFTVKANRAVSEALPLADQQDFEDATRGFIGGNEDVVVKNEQGELVWNLPAYDFIQGEAPASVNPSLWRQASLNNIAGLFKVTDRVYQVRGYDLANMSIIEGDSGWIIVDPLTSKETAAAALAMAREHLGDKPVVAVILTHSHIDHFGGVFGVITQEQYRAGEVRVIAPEGFMEEATSENIIAGIAMSRRSMLMYGKDLARSERGHVGSGLGKSPAFGTVGIIEPTEIVSSTPQLKTIDGLEFVFQNAPSSEAPAELTFSLPGLGAYCGAEVATRTMHNLYTLRGTKIRDSLKWSGYINEMIELSRGADVYFASHHWPVWGEDNIRAYLKQQRDTYKYMHDQTVRMFNAGMTPREIAEEIKLPQSLEQGFANRGYYGTLKHNSKAVYQGYLGWYDANPANLDSLPPVEAGKRYVELAGGPQALLDKASAAYDKGDYRWAAELLNHLVFADSGNARAKGLLANTYDQLGYQAESGPWRDVYLTAAYELRHGGPDSVVEMAALVDMLKRTPVEKFFQSMTVRLNGPKAEGVERTVAINFSDLEQSYLLEVKNSVMHSRETAGPVAADATLTLTHELFIRMLVGDVGLRETLTSDDLSLDGSVVDLVRFFALFDSPDGLFNVVTP
jgi:alkyl sulfatase BDS1-like metallo-beta-lactamase superfamily hydrolase